MIDIYRKIQFNKVIINIMFKVYIWNMLRNAKVGVEPGNQSLNLIS